MRRAVGFLFLLFVVAAFGTPRLLSAAYSEKKDIASPSLDAKGLTPDESLQKTFYQAVNQIYEGKLGAASQTLEGLKNFAQDQGYINLPDFSFELLNRAIQANEAGRLQEVSYYVHHSILLSPEDPRVNLAAASFYNALGFGKAFQYLLKSIGSLSANPIVYYTVKVNAWIVSLVAITLALFITSVVQIIRNGDSLYRYFKSRAPRGYSCIFAAALLAVVMIAPLFAGILTMLAVWSIVLAMSVKSCRWFALVCGLVLVLWGRAIPQISTIGFNVQQRINQVVQEINNRSFTPQGEDFIVRALEYNPNDPLLLFALAELYQLKGLDFEAKQRYEEVVKKAGENEPLKVAAHMNLATIEYQNGNLKVAESMLADIEGRGYGSFELYYNLALTKLALLNTVAHRVYFAKAQEIDQYRAEIIETSQGSRRNALMVPVPREFYSKIIFQDVEDSDAAHAADYVVRRAKLAGTLMWGATPSRISVIGIICMFIAGILFKSNSRKRRSYALVEERESSSLWLIVPAGSFIAGRRPALGSCILAVFLALVVIALEAPIHFFGSLPVSVSFDAVMITVSLLFCLMTILTAVGGHFALRQRVA